MKRDVLYGFELGDLWMKCEDRAPVFVANQSHDLDDVEVDDPNPASVEVRTGGKWAGEWAGKPVLVIVRAVVDEPGIDPEKV